MKILNPLVRIVVLLFILNSSAQERPNVILIMADDMGWGDAAYNGHPLIKTPALDAMAAEGIKFNRFYSASPVCSPTRMSFLTGRNPHRSGVFTANHGILRPEETTISEALQGVGYETGHFGKWHLGTMTATEYDANRGEPGNTKEYNPPVLHGYDKVFATESKVPTYDPMKHPDTGASYGTAFWDENNNKVTEVNDNLSGDASKVVMDRVLPFIDDANSNDKPFLAVVWFHAPHKPVVAGPTHRAMYPGQTDKKKHYYGCITAMDEQIGRLRAHLQAEGIADNTIITFCSDNGPEVNVDGTAGNYRDRKRSLYEGGVRVPSVMVWPEKITQQIITDEPFVTSDYFPTILDILDIDLPSDRSYDGESFLPLITNPNFTRSNSIGFAFHYQYNANQQNQLSYQSSDYKLYGQNENFELYDIVNDPYEETDLAGDSSKEGILNTMIASYKTWLQSVKDSFYGEEYGTTSYDKMEQGFVTPIANTPITNANFKTAINTCLSTNPVDGMCSDSEYGVMPNWDVSNVTDMSNAFKDKTSFNGDLGTWWDVSSVTNMKNMFNNASAFNKDISSWNVSSVTDMESMFNGASIFNQDISDWCVTNITSEPTSFNDSSPLPDANKPNWGAACYTQITNANFTAAITDCLGKDASGNCTTSEYGPIKDWDVSQVTNMKSAFKLKTTFNGDISNWDTSNVTDMESMFEEASIFNGDISAWNVSNVTTMDRMFIKAIAFNQDLNSWNVSKVTDMTQMFKFTDVFNGNISNWDVSSVILMEGMFNMAFEFNQDISNWDLSSVTNMMKMFRRTNSFTGDISNWDVSNVSNMFAMFELNSSFNGDISGWDVSNATSMGNMFNEVSLFNQNLSNWCVTNITSLPKNFYKDSSLQAANLPNWGSCTNPVTTTWTGTTDDDWSIASNWSTSLVPTATQNVTIPSGLTNYPRATSAVSFDTMTLRNGATFIPKSTVNGSNNITYKKRLPNTDWYLISPPVSGESMQDVISNNSLATGTGTNVGLANFINTNSNPWNYKSASSTGALNSAQGYSIKLQAAGDVSFTGSANTSDVNYTVTGGNSNNFYLLGNPFTSYVNSTAFFTKNTAHLSEQTIWLWDGTTYQTYNNVDPLEVAPVQGFFVDIKDSVSSADIVFETSNQSHQSTDTFMREAPIANFELSIESDDTKSTTKVFYVAGKTTGFDNGYDSKLFSGLANSFSVYTELVGDKQGEKLAIQTLDKGDTSIIPVGIIASVGKEITFSLESENLGDDVSIYLEDKLTGAFINVSETTYQATITEQGQGVGRFYIHTTESSLSSENLNVNNISIYQSSLNEITIKGLTDEATFTMFSVTGQKVLETRVRFNEQAKVRLPSLNSGVYIIRVSDGVHQINKKFVIK